MLVTLMFAPACGLDISRPARTSSVGGAQSARPTSLSAAIAWRVRLRSPVVTLIRRSRSSIARSPVGSSSTMPLIWLPPRPRDSSPRTLTGQNTRTFSGTTSPRLLNQRCSPSETTASTASLTVQPNRSFSALNAASGTLRPLPVRWGPIVRLKKRSGRGVTIERPGEDPHHELAQRGAVARRGQDLSSHVRAKVEMGVVDPDRMNKVQRHAMDALPVPRHQVDALLDSLLDAKGAPPAWHLGFAF